MSYGAVEANVLGETRVIVRYSVYGELDFKRVSAYMPVGQFRDLVAQQLNLDVHTVVLYSRSRVLRMNNATLEEALGATHRVNVLRVACLSEGGRIYAYTVLVPGFTVHHPLRQTCIQLVEWHWFDRLTLLLILANVAIMCINDPLEDNTAPRQVFSAYIDIVFSAFFTFELCAKVGAMGFLLAPHSFLRDAWNWCAARGSLWAHASLTAMVPCCTRACTSFLPPSYQHRFATPAQDRLLRRLDRVDHLHAARWCVSRPSRTHSLRPLCAAPSSLTHVPCRPCS